MEEMVTFLRALQRIPVPPEIVKKDPHYTPISVQQVQSLTQMDAILFRKEHAKHAHGKMNTAREKDPQGQRGGEYSRPSGSNYSQDRAPPTQYPVVPSAPQPPVSRSATVVNNPGASYPPFSAPAGHAGNYTNYPQYPTYPSSSFAPAPYAASVSAPIYSAYATSNMHRAPPPPVGGVPRAPSVPPPPARSPNH